MTSISTRVATLFTLALAVTLAVPGAADAKFRNKSGKNFTGENPLDVSRAEFQAAQEGTELIYQRRMGDALDVFEGAAIDFPDSPLGPVGVSIVYQAIMFENYDFSLDKAYLQESADAQTRFDRVARSRDKKAWNLFLLAVHQGVQAMYHVRHNDYLTGFNLAWDALENVKKVERMAPDFHDVQLALGLYNYWRTAYTENLDFLPKFGDHRAEGLAQMLVAKEKGLLAPAPASLALTYSHMESKDYASALTEAQWARARYPTSVLNEMTISRVYRHLGKFEEALAALDIALKIAPDCARLWWQIGETHYKSRKNQDASKEAFLKYLASEPLPEYKAHTLYRLGLVERRQRHYEMAIHYLEQAVATYPKFKSAAAKLEQVQAERDKRAGESKERRDRTRERKDRPKGTLDTPSSPRLAPGNPHVD